jgi:hypothetical protein
LRKRRDKIYSESDHQVDNEEDKTYSSSPKRILFSPVRVISVRVPNQFEDTVTSTSSSQEAVIDQESETQEYDQATSWPPSDLEFPLLPDEVLLINQHEQEESSTPLRSFSTPPRDYHYSYAPQPAPFDLPEFDDHMSLFWDEEE